MVLAKGGGGGGPTWLPCDPVSFCPPGTETAGFRISGQNRWLTSSTGSEPVFFEPGLWLFPQEFEKQRMVDDRKFLSP